MRFLIRYLFLTVLRLCRWAWAFSSLGQCGEYSAAVRTTRCRGCSCCRARALARGPAQIVVVVCKLSYLCGMWNPLRPGIKPGSPALADGFLSAIPPGKSYEIFLINKIL